ncbi:MAG: helix-turn-helix domain-containing protein [Oscillospiraceae bacterium]|nr:helix-turn-helix domain-containing protein [Oscillospiraceae bacterium]
MILADKIIDLRKKSGMSQEELAEKMNVSRQAVSKWEGAQSVPDLDKILALSEIFGVSTDYLLKDDFETEEYEYISADIGDKPSLRRVSLEEANKFLKLNESCAVKNAFAVTLCILSPITLIILGGLSEYASDIVKAAISENFAGGVGCVVIFLILAAAVAIFITTGEKLKSFEYLEKEWIDTDYGVTGMVRERQSLYSGKHTRDLVLGTAICIISLIPLFLLIAVSGDDDLTAVIGVAMLMALCSFGVYLLVKTSVINEGFDKLLEVDDYTRERKLEKRKNADIMVIYWLAVTAAYLGYSFVSDRWEISWVIFAVGGVLCGAVAKLAKIFRK